MADKRPRTGHGLMMYEKTKRYEEKKKRAVKKEQNKQWDRLRYLIKKEQKGKLSKADKIKIETLRKN